MDRIIALGGGVECIYFVTISGLHIVPFHWVGLKGVLGSGTSIPKVFQISII